MGVVAAVGLGHRALAPLPVPDACTATSRCSAWRFVAIHVVTTVSDGYVPIGFTSAFLPFLTPYRPIWIGLGALGVRPPAGRDGHQRPPAPDRLLVLAVRPLAGLPVLADRRLPQPGQRIRLLAFPFVLVLDALCTAAVVAAVVCRLATGRTFPPGRRAVAAVGTVLVVMALVVFAAVGPLRPGWSHRAGTSTRVAGPTGPRSTPPDRWRRDAERLTNARRRCCPPACRSPTAWPAPRPPESRTRQGNRCRRPSPCTSWTPSSTPLDVVLNGTAAPGRRRRHVLGHGDLRWAPGGQ